MARKKEKSPPGPPPVAGWMATYADMVTLLLTFFVLMVAMSAQDESRAQAVADSFAMHFFGTTATGVLPGQSGVLPGVGSGVLPGGEQATQPTGAEGEQGEQGDSANQNIVYEENMSNIITELETLLAEAGVLDQADVRRNQRGIIVRLFSSLLFEPGSASLSPEAERVLDLLAPMLIDIGNQILVEGHTCDLPLLEDSRFVDN